MSKYETMDIPPNASTFTSFAEGVEGQPVGVEFSLEKLRPEGTVLIVSDDADGAVWKELNLNVIGTTGSIVELPFSVRSRLGVDKVTVFQDQEKGQAFAAGDWLPKQNGEPQDGVTWEAISRQGRSEHISVPTMPRVNVNVDDMEMMARVQNDWSKQVNALRRQHMATWLKAAQVAGRIQGEHPKMGKLRETLVQVLSVASGVNERFDEDLRKLREDFSLRWEGGKPADVVLQPNQVLAGVAFVAVGVTGVWSEVAQADKPAHIVEASAEAVANHSAWQEDASFLRVLDSSETAYVSASEFGVMRIDSESVLSDAFAGINPDELRERLLERSGGDEIVAAVENLMARVEALTQEGMDSDMVVDTLKEQLAQIAKMTADNPQLTAETIAMMGVIGIGMNKKTALVMASFIATFGLFACSGEEVVQAPEVVPVATVEATFSNWAEYATQNPTISTQVKDQLQKLGLETSDLGSVGKLQVIDEKSVVYDIAVTATTSEGKQYVIAYYEKGEQVAHVSAIESLVTIKSVDGQLRMVNSEWYYINADGDKTVLWKTDDFGGLQVSTGQTDENGNVVYVEIEQFLNVDGAGEQGGVTKFAVLNPNVSKTGAELEGLVIDSYAHVVTNTAGEVLYAIAENGTFAVQDGVAHGDDGAWYKYDEEAKTWNELPAIEGEFDRIVVQEDGSVVALNAEDVEVYRLSVSGEWELVKNEYTTCMDPELLAEKEAEFFAEKEMSIADFVKELLEGGKIKEATTSVDSGNTIIGDMVYVGNSIVSLENLPGSVAGDRAFCGYFVQPSNPDNKIPIVIGFVFNGQYYPATNGLSDSRNGTGSKSTWVSDNESLDQSVNWFSSATGPKLGDIFYNYLFNFGDIDSYDDLKNSDIGRYGRKDALLILLKALKNDYLERLGGGGFADVFDSLDSDLGDLGAFAQYIQWTGDHGGMK